jgi:hypothetical protein
LPQSGVEPFPAGSMITKGLCRRIQSVVATVV